MALRMQRARPRLRWRRIAFTSDRDGNHEIYTISVDGTALRRLTHSPGNDAHNAWSPDGKWLVFTSAHGMGAPFREYRWGGAAWGYGVEAGTHAVRLMLSGVLDRFPKLTIVIGHMGEALPFWMWRLGFKANLMDSVSACVIGASK